MQEWELQFSELLTGGYTKQETLDRKVENMQAEIDRSNADSVKAAGKAAATRAQ